jgi:hypothetical protein
MRVLKLKAAPRGGAVLVALLVAALLAAGCGGMSYSSGAGSKPQSTPASSSQAGSAAAPKTQSTPASASQAAGIPQNNGGDQDGDNNGGPSDGDGNV